MKRLTAILIAALVLAALGAGAQDTPPKKERIPGRPTNLFGLPPQIGDKLKLTDEQKQRTLEVARKYRPQIEDIRNQMMEEFRALLTDDQKKTLDDALEQMRKRQQQARGENKRPQNNDGAERKPDTGGKP